MRRTTIAILASSCAVVSPGSSATDIADIPMVVNNLVKPNLLLILDNSQSMDAYMGGTLVAGDDAATRSNIGRQILRNTVTNFRTSFNWGLMSFATTGVAKRNTYAFYMGNDTGMVFTDDCVSGISVSNGGRRCIPNPEPFSGGNYVTYDRSGDDANILDVLYDSNSYTRLWLVSAGGASYYAYGSHNTVNSWTTGDFTSSKGTMTFSPTDAGYIPTSPSVTRQLYLPRAWGYMGNVTGGGVLNEEVKADDASHYTSLQNLLANETNNGTSTEIKNGAVFTPLKGTLTDARTYFGSGFGGKASPVTASCQRNFVVLLTDGLPTAKSNGSMYDLATEQRNCRYDSAAIDCTAFGAGSYTDAAKLAVSTAAQETIDAVAALRTTSNATYGALDVNTYVVAMGSTVDNAYAVEVMNRMAAAGRPADPDGAVASPYFASDSATLSDKISQVVDNISATSGAASAVAVANAHVTETDNASYATEFNPGDWTGDLKKFEINPATGAVSTTAQWSATAQLASVTTPAASRKIVTYTGSAGSGQGVQFQPTAATTATKLSAVQEALLGSAQPADLIAYLRGDTSREGATYRRRRSLLGDMVNAEPLIVRAPGRNYSDVGYDTFRAAQVSRSDMIYQGANDGMLHAFNGATGAEEWAYVPTFVLQNLAALSSKSGYSHRYYVDGTPVAGDVDFANTQGASGAADWRTILVGGLNKGGRGYYALDVTSAGSVADEAAATQKVLWEFPNSSNRNTTADGTYTVGQLMGYSFGKPILAKTRAYGWVVLITSGYNNGADTGGSGLGYLFVLNAKTGALLKTLKTTAGTSANPSGLTQISAYVENTDVDNTVERVYGGDLAGNVWRFDLSDDHANMWTVAKLATLVDDQSPGVPQPITTVPELAKITSGGNTYQFVFVGTGKYLGETDVGSTQKQTIYGLIDNLTNSPTIPSVRTDLYQRTWSSTSVSQAGDTRTLNAVATPPSYSGAGAKRGWYVDLPGAGERANTDPHLAYQALTFTTNIPNDTACSPGGTSFLNVLDYFTGAQFAGSTYASIYLGSALASRVVLAQLPSGKVVGIVRRSDKTIYTHELPINPKTVAVKRVSWRELAN